MKIADIQATLSNIGKKVNNKITEIQSVSFKEVYGDIAKAIFGYSKRVLINEGIEPEETTSEPTATDLMLAKSIIHDVKGGGWEGSGQAIMKMFSIILGRNLESKSTGMEARITLPKGVVIKTTSGKVGMISEQGNLMCISGNSLSKDTNFRKMNMEIEVPTEDDIILFIGKVMSNPELLRNFSSSFKVSTQEEIQSMIAVAMNGMDNDKSDQAEYRKFMANINKDLTRGVA